MECAAVVAAVDAMEAAGHGGGALPCFSSEEPESREPDGLRFDREGARRLWEAVSGAQPVGKEEGELVGPPQRLEAPGPTAGARAAPTPRDSGFAGSAPEAVETPTPRQSGLRALGAPDLLGPGPPSPTRAPQLSSRRPPRAGDLPFTAALVSSVPLLRALEPQCLPPHFLPAWRARLQILSRALGLEMEPRPGGASAQPLCTPCMT